MIGNYHKAEMLGVTTETFKKKVSSQGVKTSRELSHTDKISSRAFPCDSQLCSNHSIQMKLKKEMNVPI